MMNTVQNLNLSFAIQSLPVIHLLLMVMWAGRWVKQNWHREPKL